MRKALTRWAGQTERVAKTLARIDRALKQTSRGTSLAKNKSKPSSNSKVGPFLLLGILVLATLGVGGYYLKPTRVEVPDLVGTTVSDAKEVLSVRQLQVEVRTEKSRDPQAKADEVLRQAPAAGSKVSKGSVVTLYVAESEAGIEIPDVVGKTRSEAEDSLKRLGFEVTFKEAVSEKIEIGRVISQSPSKGMLAKGKPVELTISGGKAPKIVPDLTGLSVEEAKARLSSLDLGIQIEQVAVETFKAGDPVLVLRQEPAPESKLSGGARVTIFVPIPAPEPVENPADYPVSKGTHAPRLEGLTVAQARQLATKEGLVLEYAESVQDSAVITFQEPPAGDPLTGSSKSVLIRTAAATVVPGLSGLSESQARAELKKANLVVGSIRKSFGEQSGEVLEQSPESGIEVVEGSAVDLVLADPAVQPDTAVRPAPTPVVTPAPWVE